MNERNKHEETSAKGIERGLDSVGLYLQDISKTELLTHEQEIELGKKMEQGNKAREEIEKIEQSSTIASLRLNKLQRLADDGQLAKENLIAANTRLVVSVAKKYQGRGVPFLDLIQEGNTGLMKAADKYDYSRGYKFSTYATWWVRQSVTRAIADQSRLIRIPVHAHESLVRLNNKILSFLNTNEREPTEEELAEIDKDPLDKIHLLLKQNTPPLSLDEPDNRFASERPTPLSESIQDKNPLPDEIIESSALNNALNEALDLLSEKQAMVLRLRYGLTDGETHSLQEIADMMGEVTRERIRQLENRGLARLKHQFPELEDYVQE